MAKRRVLPPDFFSSLNEKPLDELTAVYDEHLLTAYQSGDRARRTPLFWGAAPNGLIEWLVEQGLDVNEPDAAGVSALFAQAESSTAYPETPDQPGKVRLLLALGADVDRRSPTPIAGEFTALHIAAFRGAGAAVQTLLDHGADADALDGEGRTALGRTIARANLRTLDTLAGVVLPLAAAGARISPEMRDAIVRLGREIAAVEPGSSDTHAQRRIAAYAPVARLFEQETPAGEGPSEVDDTIFVPRASVPAQHRALWKALVPAAGPAASAQGEAIRISGRLGHEILEMGGVNWDDDYRAMLEALPRLLALGTPLDETDLARAHEDARTLATGVATADSARRISELQRAAVTWVSNNTTPIPALALGYRR